MKIFVTAFPLGTGSGAVRGSTPGGDVLGCAMCEDGAVLAEHLSSGVGFARHDMGIEGEWQHEKYRAHCPDGFELVWVDDPKTHEGWQAALIANERRFSPAAIAAKAEGREA
jgi:hypothetical protein